MQEAVSDHGIILKIIEVGLPIASTVVTGVLSLMALMVRSTIRQQHELIKAFAAKLDAIENKATRTETLLKKHEESALSVAGLMHEDHARTSEEHGQILAILFFSLGLDDKNETSMQVLKSFLQKVSPPKTGKKPS